MGETELTTALPPSDSERGADRADGSADEFDKGTSIPDAEVTPVWPARKVPEVTDPEDTARHPALSLTSAMREEIWAIVRAAVQEGVAPVVAKHRELEARIERERAERERVERERPPAQVAVAKAQPLASIPVTADSSMPPAPFAVPAQRPPRLDGLEAAHAPRLDATPPAPRVMPKVSARPPGGSIPEAGFGVVVADGPKPALDLPSTGGGPIDIPDFGRRRRVVGRIIVVLMLLGVIAAIVMTALSHA